MKEFDKIYIAKYYEIFGAGELAKGFLITTNEVESIVTELKQNNLYSIYQNISDDEWEKLERKPDTYIKNKYLAIIEKHDRDNIKQLIKSWKMDLEAELRQIIRDFPIYKPEKDTFDRNYLQKENYDDEIWKKVGQLNYEVSNYGRIKNIKTKKLKRLKFNRYGIQVSLWQNSKSYTLTMSRLVATFFIRELKENERVIHKNKNIRDNYYKNLKIVSM